MEFSLSRSLSRSAFTLIELLIVIGIVVILAVAAILTLNPVQLLKQARDSNRLSDIASINSALNLFRVDVLNGSLGAASTTYLSIPDPTATTTAGTNCAGLGLPSPTPGWSYHCAASSTYRLVDGTGWIPINFSQISFSSPFGALPVDPMNSVVSGNYYTYVPGTSWALSATLESDKYLKQFLITDNGYDPGRFEAGPDLSLIAKSEGLQGWWTFEEAAGTTAGDSSGNARTGTLTNGPTWTTGKIGNALSFDGVATYVDVPFSWTIGTDYTIMAWFKTATAAERPIVSNRAAGGLTYFGVVGGKAYLYQNPCAPAGLVGTVTINDNNYHLFAFVRTSSPISGTIYIDGVQDISNAPPSCGANTGTSLRIGHDVANAIEYFPGIIDDVRIYRRALTPAEILSIYTATR